MFGAIKIFIYVVLSALIDLARIKSEFCIIILLSSDFYMFSSIYYYLKSLYHAKNIRVCMCEGKICVQRGGVASCEDETQSSLPVFIFHHRSESKRSSSVSVGKNLTRSKK
jgi:hypothetical protein